MFVFRLRTGPTAFGAGVKSPEWRNERLVLQKRDREWELKWKRRKERKQAPGTKSTRWLSTFDINVSFFFFPPLWRVSRAYTHFLKFFFWEKDRLVSRQLCCQFGVPVWRQAVPGQTHTSVKTDTLSQRQRTERVTMPVRQKGTYNDFFCLYLYLCSTFPHIF